MSQDFETACDRLSTAIDPVQFERIRWGRTEGPMLDTLVALARSSIAKRTEFELSEEGSAGVCRRFVLKVHTFRIAAVNISLDGRTVAVWGEEIDRGRGRLAGSERRTAEYDAVDQTWMSAALGEIFGEIQQRDRE